VPACVLAERGYYPAHSVAADSGGEGISRLGFVWCVARGCARGWGTALPTRVQCALTPEGLVVLLVCGGLAWSVPLERPV